MGEKTHQSHETNKLTPNKHFTLVRSKEVSEKASTSRAEGMRKVRSKKYTTPKFKEQAKAPEVYACWKTSLSESWKGNFSGGLAVKLQI